MHKILPIKNNKSDLFSQKSIRVEFEYKSYKKGCKLQSAKVNTRIFKSIRFDYHCKRCFKLRKNVFTKNALN